MTSDALISAPRNRKKEFTQYVSFKLKETKKVFIDLLQEEEEIKTLSALQSSDLEGRSTLWWLPPCLLTPAGGDRLGEPPSWEIKGNTHLNVHSVSPAHCKAICGAAPVSTLVETKLF